MRKFVLLFLAVLTSSVLLAQNRQVSGTVTDHNGDPIVGATVIVEGTSTADITNSGGRFTISAPANGTLSVSYVGYNPVQVGIEGRSEVDIQMSEYIEAIDDVIVVAFGTAKREAFTGSAAVVNAEELEKRQTSNVLNALTGTVPGFQMRGGTGQPGEAPGNNATDGGVNIRGISSMYASMSPLVILDGAPYSASLSNIPQSDIESVTVLKDAASAALYGARGASGVIIVTTKRAKSQNAVINFDMKMGVNMRALQMYDLVTDPGEYYEASFAQMFNRNYYGDGMSINAAAQQANTDMLKNLQYDVFSRPKGEWLVGSNGKLNPKATVGRKYTAGGTDYWLQPDNWLDAAYKNNLRQEYNLSVNGGGDRMSYYSSISYLNDGGIVDNSSYERIAARLKADLQARKWLKLGANIGYTHSLQDQNANWGEEASSSNLFYYAASIAPIYPIFVRELDANQKVVIKKDRYGNNMYDYGVASMGGYEGLSRPFLGTGNPLGENQYNNYDVIGNQLNGTFTVDVNFTDYLRANATSTVVWEQANTSHFGNMYYGTPAVSGGYVQKQAETAFRTNNVQTLTYFDTFGRHNINAMIGHEYYNSKTELLRGRGQGLFSPDIQELDGTALPHFSAASNSSEYNVEGYFLSAKYDFDNKYYADFSFRRDASSYFAPENRWGNFWSVGAAWILSRENFMSKASWVDMLKLKLSIGQQGNDAIGAYRYIDRFNIVDSGDGIHMSPVPATKGNRSITWETTTNFNGGVEFSFFQGRLSGSVDAYYKKTSDLLFWVSIPESSGYTGMYDNIGDLANYGVEVTLNGSVIRTRNVEWSLFANISHNKTKILSLPASKITDKGGFNQAGDDGRIAMWYKVGGEMYNAYMPSYAGVNENGESLFYIDVPELDEHGVATGKMIHKGGTTVDYAQASANFDYEQGSMLPDLYGGFGTSLRVKDFDLSVQFDYQLGGKVYDGFYASTVGANETANDAGRAIHKDWSKAWSPNNTNSNLPRWQYGDKYSASESDRFLTSASYLNFQSFMVGYTIPQSLLKDKVKIRVYAVGENLYFWSARKGLDPRYAYVGNDMVLSYSPMRTISGGLQLTF